MDRAKLFEELMEILHKVSRGFNEYESIPRKYGVDESLYMVEAHLLTQIFENEGIILSELGRRTGRTNGAISQTITRLVNKGLVCKTISSEDSRSYIASLTEKGLQAYQYHKDFDDRNFRKLLSELNSIDDEDFITCIKVLSSISKFEFLNNEV